MFYAMKILRPIFKLLSRYGWGTTLVVLACFAVGFTWSSSDKLYSNIRLFDRAALTVSSSYVEDLDEESLIKAAIEGMLSRLDQYSRYLSGADYLYLKQETEGEFEGVGISLGYHHDTLTVESVLEGTPGHRRGIKPGDRLLAIDNVPTGGLEASKIKMLLRGPVGSRVDFLIHRPGDETFSITVERARVEIKAIPYYGMAEDGIGYIRFARFSDGCSKELRSAIKDLKRLGMRSLILDLRDNPGGLLLESVEVASMFLPKDSRIVETRGKDQQSNASYFSSGQSDFQVGGMAVLVDSQTASAAEIVAGAIQDHDRGVIIGCSTYGKGLVQQVMQFSDESALKLTTAKYYLPSGRCLQKPDWSSFELSRSTPPAPTDSLFRTTSGRPVFGGGGIIPDIYIEGEAGSPYIDALLRQSCFFDFALAHVKNNVISPGFAADDSLLAEFKAFLQKRKFIFEDDGRAAFNRLRENLPAGDEKVARALEIIDSELSRSELWEFDSNRLYVKSRLEEAIALEAFGETALYRDIWIPSQPEIVEARQILSDGHRYSGILAAR